METDWDNLIANGWDRLGIRHFINVDATTGARTLTYAVTLHTPEGSIVIENESAVTALSNLDNAMTTIGPSDNYDEAVLRQSVARSVNDQRRRNAEREFNAAKYVADND